MALDLSWPKATALSVVQHAASAALGVVGGNATNVLHLDWLDIAGVSGGAALVSLLLSIVAYAAPGAKATALFSASTAAVQQAQDVIEARPLVQDAKGAR